MNKVNLTKPNFGGKTIHPHLWRDEIGDLFVLTRHMEIYSFSKTVLCCLCWKRKTYLQLKKMGKIFDDHETDDKIYRFKTELSNLPLLLSLGAFKRRPHRYGRWIKDKERRLGHRILKTTMKTEVFSSCRGNEID